MGESTILTWEDAEGTLFYPESSVDSRNFGGLVKQLIFDWGLHPGWLACSLVDRCGHPFTLPSNIQNLNRVRYPFRSGEPALRIMKLNLRRSTPERDHSYMVYTSDMVTYLTIDVWWRSQTARSLFSKSTSSYGRLGASHRSPGGPIPGVLSNARFELWSLVWFAASVGGFPSLLSCLLLRYYLELLWGLDQVGIDGRGHPCLGWNRFLRQVVSKWG